MDPDLAKSIQEELDRVFGDQTPKTQTPRSTRPRQAVPEHITKEVDRILGAEPAP